MAGVLKVDTLNADSNLALKIANTAVAYLSSGGLSVVGNSLNVGGGQIVVTSNNSISTPTVIGANLVTVSGTTALGITANGQITTANAPFILTGGQIKFPITMIPSADANTLDDYEEGTFTPTSETGTWDSPVGFYIKIGRLVYVSMVLGGPSVRSGSNQVRVQSLPFLTSSNAPQAHGCVMFRYISNATEGITSYMPTGATDVVFYKNSTSGDWQSVIHSELNDVNSFFRTTICYYTD